MTGKKCLRASFVVAVLSIFIFVQSGDAFAGGHHNVGRGRPHSKRGSSHSYGYIAPIIGGLTFLYCYSLARQKSRTTYVVMPTTTKTVIVTSGEPEYAHCETVVINIPNSNGSYTQVTLRKSGSGYIGPQGEYYPEHPTVEQLKALYGK